MDSEKGNRVFARGAQCAPPWFLEPKKSLVWIGLSTFLFFYRGSCDRYNRGLLGHEILLTATVPRPRVAVCNTLSLATKMVFPGEQNRNHA